MLQKSGIMPVICPDRPSIFAIQLVSVKRDRDSRDCGDVLDQGGGKPIAAPTASTKLLATPRDPDESLRGCGRLHVDLHGRRSVTQIPYPAEAALSFATPSPNSGHSIIHREPSCIIFSAEMAPR